MKIIVLKVLSFIGLAGTIIPSFLVFWGNLTLGSKHTHYGYINGALVRNGSILDQ